jgi:alkylation response protein AidB-like acyl-CoA dehydrogenase
MHQPGVEVRPMRTIDGESHFCEVFLTDARVPVENRVGAENDGWRVTNVTLRFERGTAFAQHIINLRTQLRRLVRMARSVPTEAGSAWDDPSLQVRVGHLEAGVEALWRMTQKGIADAEATGMPAPSGSAVKLRFSELSQELGELAVEVLGPLALAGVRIDGIDGVEVAREYLWSLQYTIAAGTSQIQRNLIAERVLGLPRGR